MTSPRVSIEQIEAVIRRVPDAFTILDFALEPMPVGWRPEESRYLRRTTREERQRFGSSWIAVYRRREG